MKKGKVSLALEFVEHALMFPLGWTIEDIRIDEEFPDRAMVTIAGDDFPEVEDGIVKQVGLQYHKEKVRIEVKKFEGKTNTAR